MARQPVLSIISCFMRTVPRSDVASPTSSMTNSMKNLTTRVAGVEFLVLSGRGRSTAAQIRPSISIS